MRVLSVVALGLVAGLVLSLAPASAAVSPLEAALDPETRVISGHGIHDYATNSYCSSDEPVLGVVDTDLTSTVRRAQEGSTARFSFHFDMGLGGAIDSGRLCPELSLEVLAPLAWPSPGTSQGAFFSMECGASGYLQVTDHGPATVGFLFFFSAPSSCGLPFAGNAAVNFYLDQGREGMVCTPVVLHGCTGASSETYPDFFCGGPELHRRSIDVAGVSVLYDNEYCYPSADNERVTFFGDGVGLVGVETTDSDCRIRLLDFFGVVDPIDCPAGDDVVRTHPWRQVFEALP